MQEKKKINEERAAFQVERAPAWRPEGGGGGRGSRETPTCRGGGRWGRRAPGKPSGLEGGAQTPRDCAKVILGEASGNKIKTRKTKRDGSLEPEKSRRR